MFLLFSSLAAFAAQPNIVLIIADDLGYGDTQLYAPAGIDVPKLEKLASQGIVASQGYVTSATCSPSRAGFMTGKYQQSFGFEYNTAQHPDAGLPVDQKTLGNYLGDAGYQSAFIGKWHLGENEEYYPMNRGFDHFWGILPGGTAYQDPASNKIINVSPPPTIMMRVTPEGLVPEESQIGLAKPRRGDNQVVTGDWPPVVVDNEDVYLTGAIAQEAARYAKRTDGPWFMAVSFTAPHTPFQSRKKSTPTDDRPEYQRVYEGMINDLDQAVGHVLKALPRDTLVVVISDNGCASYTSVCQCEPARGGKACHLEGGIRVPYLIAWRGQIEPGTYEHPISTLDLLPTFLAAAGVTDLPQDIDGVDLLPYLTGENAEAPHDKLYWRTGVQKTVREGKWKLRVNPEYDVPGVGLQGGTVLTDLATDPLEETNVSSEHPEVLARLEADLVAWEETLEAPLWPSRGDYVVDQCESWLPFTP